MTSTKCRIGLLSSVACLAFLLASAPPPNNTAWQVIGPGGGGALFQPTVSPTDANRVLVACDMTGAYRTDDGGRSWQNFNLRGRVRWFIFDPGNKDVVYARSIGLWRSTDGGQTWKLLYPNPAKVLGIAMSDDHAGESFLTSQATGSIDALAVDPGSSQTLYAALNRGGALSLIRSSDDGKTWSELSTLSDPAMEIFVDPHSPVNDRSLYVTSADSILVREHGTWKRNQIALATLPVTRTTISFRPNDGEPVIYSIDRSGIYLSRDRGASWRTSTLPGKGAHPTAIAASPTHPEIVYVAYVGMKTGWFSSGTQHIGVARSNDYGQNWELLWKGSDQCAGNVRDAWISPFFGCDYSGAPLGLVVSPSDSNIVYATDEGRILRTTDGGKSWSAIYSTQQAADKFAGRGLETTTSYGVHFDPFNARRVFVSYTDIGPFRSEDGGASWTSSLTGVPRAWQNTTYWMVFDPDVKGRAWAVMSRTHDLPRAKMWQRKSPADYDGGVVVSDDGGLTWRKSNEGMEPTAPTHIILDPRSKTHARILYVAAFGRGVYKSIDGGKTWALKNNGIAGAQPFAWRLALAPSGELYLIVARRSDDGRIGDPDDGAIYRSTDGAEHWTRLSLPSGANGPTGIAIDPRDSSRLYLSAWGRNTPPRSQGGGIFLSTDAGKSWRNALPRDQYVYDITVDTQNPKTLYAAGFESSVWRSSDSGVTWQRVPGFNFKWAHRVIPDPRDRSMVYVTTFGGGVWHGPAHGDPNAIDEIASPEVAHGK